MKFLVDAHLPPGLCDLLKTAGHDPLHTRELWWSEGVTIYYAETLQRRAGIPEAGKTRMKELEEENRRLKQMYANLSLEHEVLKDIIEKKLSK